MVTELEIFSRRLNEALDKAGIPSKGRQYKVGKMFGVSGAMGWKWLNGQNMPDTKKLPDIAKKLNTTVGFLLGSDLVERKSDRNAQHEWLDSLNEEDLHLFQKAREIVEISRDIKHLDPPPKPRGEKQEESA